MTRFRSALAAAVSFGITALVVVACGDTPLGPRRAVDSQVLRAGSTIDCYTISYEGDSELPGGIQPGDNQNWWIESWVYSYETNTTTIEICSESWETLEEYCWDNPSDPLCDQGGGGGGGDGGGSGGGGDGGGGDGGGGDDGSGSPPCDPRITGCVLPLRPEDKAWMDQWGSKLKTPQDGLCADLVTALNNLYQTDKVKRGNPNISDGTGDLANHGGTWWDGVIHIDQDNLDSARTAGPNQAYYQSTVVTMMLHEAAHSLDKQHNGPRDASGWYTEEPFKSLTWNSSNKCVAF